MKKFILYSVLFIWSVFFLYFFNMFMPKNIFYFIIGIPVLYVSVMLIYKAFSKSNKDVESENDLLT
ncbi:hypothetical protein DVB69_00390 [Sporosarcina sp. BI001-red]|nr:hypothetical protein DVB69_00390 [Sporosarcina sp. BI001-red]